MNEPDLPAPPDPPTPSILPFGAAIHMSFGQILDRIFRLMRTHLRLFVSVGMLPIGAMFAFYAGLFSALYFSGLFQHPPAQPQPRAFLLTILPISLLFVPVMLVAYGLYYGASSYAALQADHGFKLTAFEAFRHAWSKIGRYIWLMVLRGLIIAIPIFVLVFAVASGGLLLGLFQIGHPNPAALFFLIPLAMLLYLGAIAYAIVMSLRLSLAFPACVHEGLTAMQAIRRSGVLTQGAKGRIFLVLLVVYAIGYAVVMVFYAVGLFIFAIGALAGAGHLHPASPLALLFLALLAIGAIAVVLFWSVLLMAAYATSFAVIYRDQCLRKDGSLPARAPAGEPA
jgi:hypothetical protein